MLSTKIITHLIPNKRRLLKFISTTFLIVIFAKAIFRANKLQNQEVYMENFNVNVDNLSTEEKQQLMTLINRTNRGKRYIIISYEEDDEQEDDE